MPIRNGRTVTFRPVGLSDTVDSTNQFVGAMAQLSNLVPDPTTANMWTCRPAAVALTSFAGFTAPGFVSAYLVVGNIVYGLLATGRNVGKDEPFVYNLLTGVFLTVAGVTAANCPASPPSSGDWTPPIMDLVGNRVVVTHPGFAGGATKFGWFDISTLSYTASGTSTAGQPTATFAASVLQAGVQPGQTVNMTGFPAGTTVLSTSADGKTVTMSANATASATNNCTFAGGTPAAPLWGAGDCNLNPLPSVPLAVKQFNGRAFYACAAGVVGSDSGFPCQVTNASQALTFQNGLAVTALGTYGLLSQTQGGVIQSLFCFQGSTVIQQITGDFVTGIVRNQLNVSTGTNAPLSLCPTNKGLLFIAPDGLRLIDTAANVSDPIGAAGDGIAYPFLFAAHPSRICAASTAGVLRVSVLNGAVSGTPAQEYFFDLTRQVWCGPHTFPASLIQSWGQTFVEAPIGTPGMLFQSDPTPNANSTFVENGAALGWTWQTSVFPDDEEGTTLQVPYATVVLALPATGYASISISDDTGVSLDQTTVQQPGAASVWGAFNWGVGVWGSPVSRAYERPINFHQPIVARQFQARVTGFSSTGVKIGNLYLTAQPTGYSLPRFT